MSKHDYSQNIVSNIFSTIVNCKNAAQNTILSTESMSYSWDAGIIHNVVTWFEVLQINAAKSGLDDLFQKADSKFDNVVQRIEQVDSRVSDSLNDGETSLKSLKEKFSVIQEYSIQSVSLVGVFDNLHSILFSISEKYNNIDFDKLSEEEKKDYFDRLNDIPDDQLTEEDKSKIQKYINYLKNKFVVDADLSEEEKCFIALYEKIHPDEQKSMDKFFDKSSKDGINENDKFNIKYIAYTSEGDCHTIFFEYIDRCRVDTWCYTKDGKSGTSHYDPQDGAVRLNLQDGKDGVENPRGAYNTVFHELGHNIDDLMMDNGYFTTSVVSDGNFYDVIYEDVENNFKEAILKYSKSESVYGKWSDEWGHIDEAGQKKILDVLMGRADQSCLNYRLSLAYRKIYEEYTGVWLGVFSQGKWSDSKGGGIEQGAENEQIADITGGITNHSGKYYGKSTYRHSDYWYAEYDDKNGNGEFDDGDELIDRNRDCKIDENDIMKDGEIITKSATGTGMHEKEFFAEYFAYEMTSSENEENARKYFKESYESMDEAIAKKAEEIRNRPSDEEMLQTYWARRNVEL